MGFADAIRAVCHAKRFLAQPVDGTMGWALGRGRPLRSRCPLHRCTWVCFHEERLLGFCVGACFIFPLACRFLWHRIVVHFDDFVSAS
jgi:hypothetical protein